MAIVIIPMTTLRDAIILKAAIVQFLESGHTLTLRKTTPHTLNASPRTRINTSLARSILLSFFHVFTVHSLSPPMSLFQAGHYLRHFPVTSLYSLFFLCYSLTIIG